MVVTIVLLPCLARNFDWKMVLLSLLTSITAHRSHLLRVTRFLQRKEKRIYEVTSSFAFKKKRVLVTTLVQIS